jgi:hypothetical protein
VFIVDFQLYQVIGKSVGIDGFEGAGGCLRIVFNFFAILYAGAVLLLTTGLMGMLGLCSFSRALSVGGHGFF